MCDIKEIIITGSRAKLIAEFLESKGAKLIKIDNPNKYVFEENNNLLKAISELQVMIRDGFYV